MLFLCLSGVNLMTEISRQFQKGPRVQGQTELKEGNPNVYCHLNEMSKEKPVTNTESQNARMKKSDLRQKF